MHDDLPERLFDGCGGARAEGVKLGAYLGRRYVRTTNSGSSANLLAVGAALTGALVLGLGWICFRMFETGYKIKT